MIGLDSLPETILVPRTDPIYNCHGYLTKVPIGAIQPFIEAFTDPDDLVVDFFAGSGMTGLAALTLNRRARLSDISVLGQHIARGYLTRTEQRALESAAREAVGAAKDALGSLYLTQRDDGSEVEMVRTVWSFTYECPSCEYELIYLEHLDERGRAPTACPNCQGPFARRNWTRGADVPMLAVVRQDTGRQMEKPVSDYDRTQLSKASKDARLADIPSQVIDSSREMFSRSGLGKSGMTETRMFFSDRNAIALLELWRAIESNPSADLRQKLRFAFTAILPRASKRYQWSAKRPLNAQNQTYYIAPVYYEWNVFELFERKVNAANKATKVLYGEGQLFGRPGDVTYELASAENLAHLDNESVDYVFTDPPFGSNIFYSDMNLFHEAWLGMVTDHASEAVVHTTGSRKSGAEARYEALLRSAFQEALRVLKPGKLMSVVFGNSSGRIWGLVQRALRDAGFKAAPVHVAILDKGQRSVKGLNSGSESVVTVDLIVTVQKPAEGERADDATELANGDTAELLSSAIAELPEEEARNPSHVYARILRKAIQRHLTLDALHLSDVLIALRNNGYAVDRKTGLLSKSEEAAAA
ncbi:MAG: DNA methyltransferase [Pseudomonadota bacterium]